MKEGLERKKAGIEQITGNTNPEWKTRAQTALELLLAECEYITADDFRRVAASLGVGDPHHPNAWSAIVSAAAKRGEIEFTGRVETSTRPEAHGRMIRVWRRRERRAA